MTGDPSQFSKLTSIDEGYVTFGDNNKGKIIGKGTIGNKSNFFIKDVLLVDGLKHNLLSISQLCDKGYIVKFESNACIIEKPHKNMSMIALKQNNVYTIDINDLCNEMCFSVLNEDAWLWHRRLGHASMKLITQISSKELVRGIPHIKFIKDNVCDACQLGKQIKGSFKSKNQISTSRPLQLIHMDLFGPISTSSLGGSKYAFVIVDYYSRYTWTYFLKHKNEYFRYFTKFCKLVQNEKGFMISSIRSDHGGEFQNHDFQEFCELNGYNHNFSTPRNPQQNGVVERKNRNLQEMARTMLNEHSLPKYFWAEAVNTACYILNRVLVRPLLTKTPYELWNNKKPNVSYFKVFGCKCFILNEKDALGKFDAKSDEGIFLGYSSVSKAFRIFNKRTLIIEESIHVVFNEISEIKKNDLDDDVNFDSLNLNETPSPTSNLDASTSETSLPKDWKYVDAHPKELILGDTSKGVQTRSSFKNFCANAAFLS